MLTLALMLLVLGGCGKTLGERRPSGSQNGTATNVSVDVQSSGAILGTAAAGAAAGAATGRATSPARTDSQKPIWEK
jgi:hypothetical protein